MAEKKGIPITKGYSVTVDPADYSWASKVPWFAQCDRAGLAYAARWERLSNGKRKEVRLHRKILEKMFGAEALRGKEGDHINGDTMDNRRCNLRIVDKTTNLKNKGRYRSNSSGRKGLYWDKHIERWRVCFRIDKKLMHYGAFKTRTLAEKRLEEVLHGLAPLRD